MKLNAEAEAKGRQDLLKSFYVSYVNFCFFCQKKKRLFSVTGCHGHVNVSQLGKRQFRVGMICVPVCLWVYNLSNDLKHFSLWSSSSSSSASVCIFMSSQKSFILIFFCNPSSLHFLFALLLHCLPGLLKIIFFSLLLSRDEFEFEMWARAQQEGS